MSKYAPSTTNQKILIAKFMNKHGSINRYHADAIGVCHLAARIYELRNKGFKISSISQLATDPHGIEHKGISRYWFDYKAMTKEQIETLNKLLGKS
ncbi:helix-turn-helix domain-containing protein [Pseudoalteromonas sp. TAB23]|uniref:helix-turn-helix domain-containing protein n=1 Tax=Pseudoalteromonas sp. TAB23 TaxID=1938595 RepID=UPI00042902D4|nr:helix-turn-helix domain-containing protein [Pseudoalteromonas sp. TAB23]